jgi:hypothetical protein
MGFEPVDAGSNPASPTLVSFYFSQVGCAPRTSFAALSPVHWLHRPLSINYDISRVDGASLTFLRYRFKYWVQLYSDRVSGRPLQIIQIQLSTVALYIMTGKIGLSEPSVATSEIVVICSQPSVTLPNTV